MNRSVVLCALLCSVPIACPQAHELAQSVSRGNAVVIALSYPDGSPFAYESYEIYREGEDLPFQTGRSDALGRIVFVPDRQGMWRIRAFSEDGHGIDKRLEAGPAETARGASASSERWQTDRYGRIALGVFVILSAFAVVFVVIRRRAS